MIEDSARLQELLGERVRNAGWRLDTVATAVETRAACANVSYDLALLDLGLPDADGIALIRQLRRAGFIAPILVITARTSIEDRVAALDGGADDYLVKPFNHVELLARCRALLRRSTTSVTDEIVVGSMAFEPATRVVRIAGELVSISPRERSVLDILLRAVGRVVPKEQIEVALSEVSDEITTNAVELAVSRLRRRLASYDHGISIETVRGIGYLLREARSDV